METDSRIANPQVYELKKELAPPADLTLTVVKWLVPTAGILFVLVGYVIDSAHRSLLAFPTDDGRLDDGGRIQDTSDFLRFFFTLIGDRLITLASGTTFSLGGHWLLLLCSTVVVCAAVLGNFLPEHKHERVRTAATVMNRALPCLAVMLVATKFVYFDAPIMRLESVVVGIGVPKAAVAKAELVSNGEKSVLAEHSSKDAGPLTKSLTERLKESSPAPIGNFVSDRAFRLWRLMACARIGDETFSPAATLAQIADCFNNSDKLNKLKAQSILEGEFDAGLWMGGLIAMTASALLFRRTASSTVLAVLAFVCLVTVPYAWGKLLKPVDFSYALIRGEEKTFLVSSGRGEQPRDVGATYAFVLTQDAGSVTLLQGVRESCGFGSSIALRFSSVPASKILAIEQIFRLDVIEWALRTQIKCPVSETFGQ